MDPLSGLSVACTVVQFIDYGLRTVRVCKEVYESNDGITRRNAELKERADRLRELFESLGPSSGSTITASTGLEATRIKCLSIAEDLKGLLESVEVPQGKKIALKVVHGSINAMMKSKKIDKIEKDLRKCTAELDSQVLAEIHSKLNENTLMMNDAFKSMSKDHQALAAALLKGHQTISGIVSAARDSGVNQVTQKLDQIKLDAEQDARNRRLRDSLFFPEIWSREGTGETSIQRHLSLDTLS